LIDTAGIRNTDDKVEQIGVEKARQYAQDADLILFVSDSSMELDENDLEIISFIQNRKSIVLLNKADLPAVLCLEEMKKLTGKPVIEFSAKESYGLDELTEQIERMFFQGEIAFNDEAVITNVRHIAALEEAYESVKIVKESIMKNMPEDFYTIDMMQAYQQLGYIIGEVLADDVADEIFSKFCTGK
jgi:tRNA modification GTPase